MYKVGGNDVLTATTLGSGVLYSSLQTLGELQQLNVAGNVAAGNLSANSRLNSTNLSLRKRRKASGQAREEGVSDERERYPHRPARSSSSFLSFFSLSLFSFPFPFAAFSGLDSIDFDQKQHIILTLTAP